MFFIEVWSNEMREDMTAQEMLIAARSTRSAGSARMIANHAKAQGHWVNLIHPDGHCEAIS